MVAVIPAYMEQHWTSNIDLVLYTDASDLAVAGHYQGTWFVELIDTSHSITWRELYAVVLAAATWSKHWDGKKVLFYCDNLAVCYILCSKTSKSPALMQLLRTLFLHCCWFSVSL